MVLGNDTLSNLPYDICECISHFLSDSDLSTLRAINPAFYNLSILRRYRSFTLSVYWLQGIPGPQIIRGFKLSSRPFLQHHLADLTEEITGHIRSLQLVFTDGYDPKMLDLVWDNTARLKRSAASTVRLDHIADFFSRLIRLEDLTVLFEGFLQDILQGYPPSDRDITSAISPLMPSSLISVAHSLRSLEIYVPMESWKYILSPSVHLGKLDRLVIHFLKASNFTSDIFVHNDILIPFIQRHSGSLQTLQLVQPYNAFYTDFPIMPFLKTFIIEEACIGVPLEDNNIHDFLQQHSEMITRIIWRMPDDQVRDDFLGRTPWFDLRHHDMITFPNLRALELRNMDQFSSEQNTPFPELQLLLQGYCHTLTRLCLPGYKFQVESLHELLRTMARSRLEHLEICVDYLVPVTFFCMTMNLRRLRVLNYSYGNIDPSLRPFGRYSALNMVLTGRPRGPEAQSLDCQYFVLSMRQYPLLSWGLRELFLDCVDKGVNTWDINRAIIHSLPNLSFINDYPIDEYLDSV